jgi:3-deoxy-D-manno-octulosonic-acid transferase
MSVAWSAYRIAAPAVGMLAPAARFFTPAAERATWAERLGAVSVEGGCDAWLHAASLGEATAIGPLARALTRARPAARLLATATSATGRARLQALAASQPRGTVSLQASFAPIDSPQAVRRFMAGARPARLFLVETELWPHWLLAARAAGVPVAVLSARLSPGSLARYRRLGRTFRALVHGLEAVLCQTAEDLARWIALGARPDRSEVAGNLKADALPAPGADRARARAALGLETERPLLVLGSLRPGEVAPLARAWQALPAGVRRGWQVVAVPRHPRASAELAEEASRARQALARDGAAEPGAWHWDDRTGVLLQYYAAADVAFVGGSLRPYGGHNPLEPAACGAAVILGPYYASQLDAVRALREGSGVWIASSPQELLLALRGLLGDGTLRAARATAALEVVTAQRGATARTVARLEQLGLWPGA